uniref:Uncharacterized protein n=1 Tax=candidate division WOR-3 bacterium TaxID=2052148 RepID=A0A7C6A9K5_UNCW3
MPDIFEDSVKTKCAKSETNGNSATVMPRHREKKISVVLGKKRASLTAEISEESALGGYRKDPRLTLS